MLIRRATLTDIPSMQTVRLAVQENRLSDPSGVTYEDYVNALEHLGCTWVIESQANIVAFASAFKSGNIWALFVHPDHERKGYGKILHQAMIDWAWAQGLTQLNLSTDSKTKAEKFYMAHGWEFVRLDVDGEVHLVLNKT
jgi:GNAT superfamily N-acetyltransferase